MSVGRVRARLFPNRNNTLAVSYDVRRATIRSGAEEKLNETSIFPPTRWRIERMKMLYVISRNHDH